MKILADFLTLMTLLSSWEAEETQGFKETIAKLIWNILSLFKPLKLTKFHVS